jgi:hypothetical protein
MPQQKPVLAGFQYCLSYIKLTPKTRGNAETERLGNNGIERKRAIFRDLRVNTSASWMVIARRYLVGEQDCTGGLGPLCLAYLGTRMSIFELRGEAMCALFQV